VGGKRRRDGEWEENGYKDAQGGVHGGPNPSGAIGLLSLLARNQVGHELPPSWPCVERLLGAASYYVLDCTHKWNRTCCRQMARLVGISGRARGKRAGQAQRAPLRSNRGSLLRPRGLDSAAGDPPRSRGRTNPDECAEKGYERMSASITKTSTTDNVPNA
jgi:hypothetical protein